VHPARVATLKLLEKTLLRLDRQSPGSVALAWATKDQTSSNSRAAGLRLEQAPHSLLARKEVALPESPVALGLHRPVALAGANSVDTAISYTRNAVIHVAWPDATVVTVEHTTGKRHVTEGWDKSDPEVDGLLRSLGAPTPPSTAPVQRGIVMLWGIVYGRTAVHLGRSLNRFDLDNALLEVGRLLEVQLPPAVSAKVLVGAIDAAGSELSWDKVMQTAVSVSPELSFHDAGSFSRSPQLEDAVLAPLRDSGLDGGTAAWAASVLGAYLFLAS
jgi:hypothetical protein